MKTWICICLMGVLLGCSSPESSTGSGIVGTWKEKSFENTVTYNSDGTFRAKAVDPKGQLSVQGLYQISGEQLNLHVVKMTDTAMTSEEQSELDSRVKSGNMDRKLKILKLEGPSLQVEDDGKRTSYSKVP